MKKRLIVILFIACLFLLTGCNANDYVGGVYNNIDQTADVVETVADAKAKYGATNLSSKTILGFLSVEEYDVPENSSLLSGKYYVFYQSDKEPLPEGEYYVVYGSVDTPDSYPEVVLEGLNYAGYFKADGSRVATLVDDSILYVRYMTFPDAGLVVAVCMAIVFSILALLWGLVTLFKYISPNNESKKEEKPVVQRQQIKIEDIKDEDMMVAVLVASIDYHEETQQDVRVVSVREL